MCEVIKSVGYTVKSGDLYLQNHSKDLSLNPDIRAEFSQLSDGFELISWKGDAKKIAKKCGGNVIKVLICDEGKPDDEEQN